MATVTEPKTDPITEPQRVLYLSRAGLATREIGRILSLSQSTVSRRLREATEGEAAARWRRFWTVVMFALLTSSAVILAAAVATLAWGH